jgi:hypothetical protein
MEKTEEPNANKKCTTKTRGFRGRANPPKHQYQYQHQHQHQHQLLQYSNQYGFSNQNQYQRYYPALLPLPPQIPLQLALTPPLPQNQSFITKTHLYKPSCKLNNPPLVASSDTQVRNVTISTGKHQRPLLLFVRFFTPLFASCSLEVQVWFMVKDSGEDMCFVHVAYYRSFNHWRRPRIEKDVLFTLFSLFFFFHFFFSFLLVQFISLFLLKIWKS